MDHKVTAIFPTAETLVKEETDLLLSFYGGPCKDQYASSEGASFLIECEKGKLHYEMLSGVIEVVNDKGEYVDDGKMLITSFSTRGTPLIRYDIGDSMTFDHSKCSCGRNTPVVKKINGRVNDFIYSQQTGKCNLGNISNCVKYVKGIIKFQVVQDKLDEITVLAIVDSNYDKLSENSFRKELEDRLGQQIRIEFKYVDFIAKTKIGKHRIVINNVKHLIN